MVSRPARALSRDRRAATRRRRSPSSSRLIAALYDEMLDASRRAHRRAPCAQASRLGARCRGRDGGVPAELLKSIARACSPREEPARGAAAPRRGLRRLRAGGRPHEPRRSRLAPRATSAADAVLNALPHPVIMVAPDGKIADANVAAEALLRSLDAAAAPARAARPRAVRLAAARADRAGAPARRGGERIQGRSRRRRAIRASASSICMSRRCRNSPATSS